MPELPEVETVRRQLEDKILNLEIDSVSQSKLNLRKPFSCSTKKVKLDSVSELGRWGKRLFIHLDSNQYFDISLGMTGSFRVESENKFQNIKHDHIKIRFTSGERLVFNDPRRFGWFELQKGGPTLTGWDPVLSPRKDFKAVVAKAKKTEVNAFTFLMDQKNIIGLGNIYVQEILFHSGVSPFRKINKCTASEMELIRKNTNKVLKQALSHGGSTIVNYKNANGESGNFQKKLHVYGKKKGEACTKCKSAIVHKQLSRAICYCPNCQI